VFEAVLKRGFVDTTAGLELTRSDALNLLQAVELDRNLQVHGKEKFEDYKRSERNAEIEKKRLYL